jgi:hypothetical protein
VRGFDLRHLTPALSPQHGGEGEEFASCFFFPVSFQQIMLNVFAFSRLFSGLRFRRVELGSMSGEHFNPSYAV